MFLLKRLVSHLARPLLAALCAASLLAGCAQSGPQTPVGPSSQEAQAAELHNRVKQVWVVPRSLQKSPRALSARLLINCDDAGNVKTVKLLKRTGARDVDASLVKAVLDASPLPMPADKARAAQFHSLELTLDTADLLTAKQPH